MYQQAPQAVTGAIFGQEGVRYYRRADLPQRFVQVCMSVDATFKDHKGSDYVFAGVWGKSADERVWLLSFRREKLSFTRTAANDLGPDGITVNMVSGGLLRTTDASRATPEAVFDLIASLTPLRRVTTPEEFADAVLFFLSPWARAVTGQNLVVDSGLVKD